MTDSLTSETPAAGHPTQELSGYRRYADPLFAIPLLIVLSILPHWSLYFDIVPKVAVLFLGTAWLVCSRRNAAGIAALGCSMTGRLLIGGFLLQIVSLALSSAVSHHRLISFLGTGWRRLGTLEYLALLLFAALAASETGSDRARRFTVIRAISLSCLLVSVYGIIQYVGWDPLIDNSLRSAASGYWMIFRPSGTLGHATYFANYLSIAIFVCAAVATVDADRAWRAIAAAGGWAGAIALVLTGTRAGLLGVGAGGCLLLLQFRPAITRKRIAAVMLIALAGAGVAASPVAKGVRDRTSQWFQDPKGGPRLLLWRDSLQMSADNLAFGVGPETFGAEFPRYTSLQLARAYPDAYHESAHNAPLEALTSQGIAGLLIFLGLMALGMWGSSRWADDTTTARILAAGLVSLFVSQQFTAFVLPTAFLFYLTVGILVAGTSGRCAERDSQPFARIFRAVSVAAVALFLVAAVRIVYVDMSWSNIQRALDDGRVHDAVAAYPSMRGRFPVESGADLWYSRALLRAAQSAQDVELQRRIWGQAVDSAAHAALTSEDQANARYNLALLRIQQGDVAGGRAATESAISIAPNWYKPHWLLAEVFLSAGNTQSAGEQARIAVQMAGNSPELKQLQGRIAMARNGSAVR